LGKLIYMDDKELTSEEKIRNEIRKLDGKAILIGIFGLLVLFIFPILTTQYNLWFDFTSTGPIGDTIGGLTSPIIGFFSALLIYLSFRAQIKANYIVQSQIEKQEKNENEKKEIEFINNLLNQLREEINEFEITNHIGKASEGKIHSIHGAAAITHYFYTFSLKFYKPDEFLNNPKNQQYLGLIEIMEKLIQIIIDSNIKKSDKEYFKSRSTYLFDYKLAINPRQEILHCEKCGEYHTNVACIINSRFKTIEAKLDFLEHFEK